VELLIGLIIVIIFFSPLIALLTLRTRLKKLEDENVQIRKRLEDIESNQPFGTQQSETEKSVDITDTSSHAEEKWQVETDYQAEKPVKPKKFKSARKVQLEKKFLENWTGILGAVIVVLGAGFLSLYAAVNMNEFARFMLLLLLAALPAVLFYLLKNKEHWMQQALWLRSISGAIFLFACLGSGGLPGLKWIQNPLLSLTLLMAGIIVNLYLGSAGGKQFFASFHTILSLVALSVIPPDSPTLFIALVICLYAVFKTYKSRWDKHLLITLSGFFLFHLRWMHLLDKTGMSEMLRLQGAAVVLILFLTAALIHYRKNYSTGKFELVPFIVHLANWLYFAVAMVLYAGEYNWRTFPLLLAALTCYLLSRIADKKNIQWLKITDTLLFLALLTTALLTLTGWNLNLPIVSGLIFAETILFARIMIFQKEYFLFRTGINISYAAALFVVVTVLGNSDYSSVIISAAAVLLALTVNGKMFIKNDKKWLEGDTLPGLAKSGNKFSMTPLIASLLGIISSGLLLDLNDSWCCIPLAALPLITILLFYIKYPSISLKTGSLIYLTLFFFSGLFLLFSKNTMFLHLTAGISLLVTSILSSYIHRHNKRKKIPVRLSYIITILTIIILSWALMNPVSPWLPGVFWLSETLIVTALPHISRDIKIIALLFPAAYFFRHFTVHIHLEQMLGPVPIRYLMDILLLPVLYFIYRKRSSLSNAGSYKWLTLIQEFMLLFTTLALIIEVTFKWTGPVMMLLAAAVLASGLQQKKNSRFILYSFLIYLLSLLLLLISVITEYSLTVNPLPGILTITVAMAYIALFYVKAHPEQIENHAGKPLFPLISNKLNLYREVSVVYPLTAVTALFIYLVFQSEIHTLLWALECFILFATSLIIKKESFRYISQAGMLICVGRLVLFDLSGSSVFLRGLVFLGVGTLLLGINGLYMRFNKTI